MTVEPSEPRRDAVLRISDIDRGAALTQLQQAELEGRLTGEEFEARATMLRDAEVTSGSARIILPPGASADINHFHGGSVQSKVPDQPVGDAPHFRISGSARSGSLHVKYRRRRLFRR